MFNTPQSQRKGWAGWGFSPKSSTVVAAGIASASVVSKGKQVVDGPPPPPPRGLLEERGGVVGGNGTDVDGEAEVWRSFKEAGFLDESVLQKREKEAMTRRITELDRELHEYQYNLGLLIIEKKEWALKFEELKNALVESEELLKREQSAHFIAISELEKREENARQALGIEKQCVTDLEKALREIRAQLAEVKVKSETKLAEAHALEASLEEKYLEVQAKLHSADAKLAEANRKSSEVERKLEDAENRERKLERERLSLATERKAHETDLSQQRAYLQDWEKKLQEGQKRLLESQSSLNEREQRVDESKRTLKEKERELHELQEKIEANLSSLRDKEDNMSTRLRVLIAKEQEADSIKRNLEEKEKKLRELEVKLNTREKVEMQKLLDDHKTLLSSREHEFDSELEERRRLFDEEMKNKLIEIEKRETEVQSKEDMVLKREAAVENKLQKLVLKENDADRKLELLEDRERSLNEKETNLLAEKQQIAEDSEKLQKLKTELQNLNTDIEAREQKLIIEANSLKITQQEREQFELMRSELKKEIDDYRLMKESLHKQIEDLRQEREDFEREWDSLDEKRKALDIETKLLNDEKEKLEKWQKLEEQRLINERQIARVKLEADLEDLHLKEEAFENLKAHEQAQVRELLDKQQADLSREYILLKHELEINIQRRQEEMEKKLQEKEDEFDRRKDLELSSIKSSINLNELKLQKLRAEEERISKEKEELYLSKQKHETDRLEIQKDIDTLGILSRNLKQQREEFIKERDHFLAAVEKCKTCQNCGITIDLEPVYIESLRRIEEAGNGLLPMFADGILEEHSRGKNLERSPKGPSSHSTPSEGRMSWLRKCTRLFNFSPGKKAEGDPESLGQTSSLFSDRLDKEALEDERFEEEASLGVAGETIDAERDLSGHGLGENVQSQMYVGVGDRPEPSLGVADNSILIEDQPLVATLAEQNEREACSVPSQNDQHPQALAGRRRQPSRRGRPKGVKRTRTVKAVVEEAKAILGETTGDVKEGHPNGDTKDSLNVTEESQGDSVHAGKPTTSARPRKRSAFVSGLTASDQDAEDSEPFSESVSQGGRRKRHQTVADGVQTPGERRYNLRRSRKPGTFTAQASSDQARGLKTGNHQHPSELEALEIREEESLKHANTDANLLASGENGKAEKKVTISENLPGHSESHAQKVVEKEARIEIIENIVVRSIEISEQSEEDGEEVDGAEVDMTPATPSGGDSGGEDEDDYEEDDEEKKQNASIGKKIWNFFTT